MNDQNKAATSESAASGGTASGGADGAHEDYVRDAVRERYAGIVAAIKGPGGGSGCCGPVVSCCGGGAPLSGEAAEAGGDPLHRKVGHEESLKLGYTEEDLLAVPEGANLGLGCGNPKALAELQTGEVVVDLGAGAGFDCFLAARAVGPTGQVIGVDMTPEMVRAARENARKGGYAHVDFRLGEIEHLPVADGMADVVISNCVINLSPDKQAVYKEAFRVLKRGGRLAVSDVVATAELPEQWLDDMQMLSGCIAGASTVDEVEAMLAVAGFVDIDIRAKEDCREFIREWQPGTKIEDYVLSANMTARRP